MPELTLFSNPVPLNPVSLKNGSSLVIKVFNLGTLVFVCVSQFLKSIFLSLIDCRLQSILLHLPVMFPLHVGRAFPDELPAKCCLLNLLISCQRSTETRLSG